MNRNEQKQSLEQFLAARGLSSPFADYTLDKCRLPHGETARRQAAIAEYNAMVAARIVTPKTRTEILIDRANGHPDNESTQAARRMCAKRGIEWKI